MTRINVYSRDGEWSEYTGATLAGWFDKDKATEIREDTEWDGSNHISLATGSQWDHQRLYRTAQGRWVLNNWSQRQGVNETYTFITADQAREWLLQNNKDETVIAYLGPVEEERGPGRPEIGGKVLLRLGDQLEAVDAYARDNNLNRAEAVRTLVGEALAAARPYAVTALDISTRVRETLSRHASLSSAVEALREEEAYDAEDNGLPSRHPRVEHDGRPVDTEAMAG